MYRTFGIHSLASSATEVRNEGTLGALPYGQTGIALVVSLILLLVITLIGITAIRLTTVQQKIAANFYDRELAFQNAEAALRVAAQDLAQGTAVIARNCGQGGAACQANPFTDPNFTATPTSIPATDSTGAGPSQYVIENMGAYANPNSSTGFNQTANAAQYGAQGVSGVTSIYYRITARSGDPAQVGDRAVVTLQALYRQ